MNLEDLLGDLSSRGVKIWAEDGQLRVRAPQGAVTSELKAALTEHKPELLRLLGQQRISEQAAALPLVPVPRDRPLPLSFMQERLWFLQQMYPDSAVYNLPNARRMRGRLDVDALQFAVDRIIERHEALRTTFRGEDLRAEQIAAPTGGAPIELVDLSELEDPMSGVDELALRESNRSFDLSAGPLLRVFLVRVGPDDHVFLWFLHHIVSDGWSSMIFLRELKALYEQHAGGPEADLPELPVQFADFAAWEREYLQGEVLEEQLSYWRDKLGGRLPVLELPGDHPRPAVLSYRGRCHPLAFSQTLTDGLRDVAQRTGTTLYMVLVAALKVFLHRYTRQTDICIGSPIARRTRPEIENVTGCFINTLVLRTDLSGDPNVLELLERVRETCTGAMGRQDVPFEKLIDELQPARDPSHTPLFQMMLILHVQDTRKVDAIGDVQIEALEYHASTSKFDLTLELKETTDGLEGWFEYSTELFEESTIARMAGQFEALLAGIASAPDTPLSRLPLLPAREREQLLSEWNDTAVDYPRDACVQGLVSAQAAAHPDRVAVESSAAHLSYRELEERSNRLARYLQGLGVGGETLVGIHLERSLEMVVALLGILKAGGAYVPLDPSFPRDRLSFMVSDAELSILISEVALRDARPDHGGTVVEIDADWDRIAQAGAEPVACPAGPDSLAYVIYTSGSTGLPKGVQLEHRSLVNFLCSMQREPGLTAEDRLLAVTTLSFDIAGLELYLPLITGATVVVASGDEQADGERLAARIEAAGISVMQATPATWRMMIDAGWRGSRGLRVLCGGEALPRELANELLGRCAELWNMYGPTETTIWSTVCRMQAGDGPVLVGRGIANTTVYVLDDQLQLVPTGVPGELFIGGDGLARGYHERPELTAERFVPDPFAAQAGARMYRTGDLARHHPDGTLEVLGRIDNQVKLRGFRIELGEIETVLAEHSDVQQAIVVAREDTPGDKRLVAYHRAAGRAPTVSELRAHLRERLPDYMVPSSYIEIDSFPLTPNGKVDRLALPAPDQSRPELEHHFVAPRTPGEEVVAGIWRELLGLEQVGVHDGFFDLGGHSLLALRLVSELERRTGRRVALVELFQKGTVEHLGRLLDGDVEQAEAATGLSAIRRTGTLPPFFAGGSHPRYAQVARHMDAERPFFRLDVYAQQAERAAAGKRLYRRFESMATEFLEEMRAIQPEGPYYLGGGCEGAFVAFEIARQLQVQGESVERLVLWVAPAPGHWKYTGLRRLYRQAHGLLKKGRLRDLGWREFIGLVKHEYLEHRIYRAMDLYKPETPYRGRLVVVRTAEDMDPDDPEMGWREFATDGVDLHVIDGEHATWIEDHAEQFAKILDSYLLPEAVSGAAPAIRRGS